MLRSDARLDPAARNDLDRLDAVLGGDHDADPQLALLADDIASVRPRMDDETQERLDARIAALTASPGADGASPADDAFGGRPAPAGTAPVGGGRPPVGGGGWRDRLRRPRWRIAIVGAAVLVAAVPVVVAVQRFEEDAGFVSAVDLRSSDAAATAERAPTVDQVTEDASATSAATSATSSTAGGAIRRRSFTRRTGLEADRQIIRDVRQTVRIRPDGVGAATTKVNRIVDDAGGYLASSQVREAGSGAGGSFGIVVPSDRLDETVSRLSTVGQLARLERSSTDITDDVTSVADRLRDQRADRAALRLQLARTVDPDRRAARRRELRLLSSRVARLESEQRFLREQVGTSRIGLRLTTTRTPEAAAAEQDGVWGLRDAWRDAGQVLQVVGGVLLIAATIVVPLAVLVALVVAGRRRLRRARRDRAIDDA